MATSSSSLFNFLSLLIPSKPPPSKTQLPTIVSTQTSRTRDGSVSVPLISANETQPLSISHDVSSVVCPSLAYSNTLYFKSAYNVQVIVDDNEPEEKLLNRFRREVMRAGVIQECKRRRFFENKQEEKKRRTRDAAKRNRRRRPQSRLPPQGRQFDAPKTKKDDEEEDNWELPEGGIPS